MSRSGTRVPRLLHRIMVASLTALLVAGLYATLRDASFFRTLEGEALNFRFELRGPTTPGAGIVLVTIDDQSIAETGGWPLPRHVIASLIDRLAEEGADIVVVDLLLTDLASPSDGIVPGPGDQQLIEIVRRHRNLVFPMALVLGGAAVAGGVPVDQLAEHAFRITERENESAAQSIPIPQGALAPFEALRGVAALGQVNLVLDADGGLRAAYHALGVGDLYFPSLSVVVLALREKVPVREISAVLGRGIRIGGRLISTGPDMSLPINFLGPAGTFETHSLIDLLEARTPPDAFRDRIVFVGANALGIGDGYSTPYGVLPGVEALAAATDNLLNDGALVRDARSATIDLMAIVVLALLMAALPRLGRGALFAAVALILAWEAIVYLAFVEANWWLDATFPAMAGLLSAAAVLALWFADERRGRRVAEQDRAEMAPFVSPVVAAGLADAKEAVDRPRPAAVMFVDMAGYTTLAESLEPAGASALLQDFRAHLSRIAARHGGIIEKFVGDGAMILFGVPEPDLLDPVNALGCARDLVLSPPVVVDGAVEPVRWKLHIGLHYGPVTLAHIGDQVRAEITATGDTVNVASRLEVATREYDAVVAASGAIAESVRAAGHGELLDGFSRQPDIVLRGRQEPIDIWLWAGPSPAAPS
jgi:adenylate cyclase